MWTLQGEGLIPCCVWGPPKTLSKDPVGFFDQTLRNTALRHFITPCRRSETLLFSHAKWSILKSLWPRPGYFTAIFRFRSAAVVANLILSHHWMLAQWANRSFIIKAAAAGPALASQIAISVHCYKALRGEKSCTCSQTLIGLSQEEKM